MMNEQKKISKTTIKVLAFIVLAVGIYVVVTNLLSTKAKKEITEGYALLADMQIEEYLSDTEPDEWGDIRCEYALSTGLKDIRYEITNIARDEDDWKDEYILSVSVFATCNEEISSKAREELAQEIFWEFVDVDNSLEGIKINDYICKYHASSDNSEYQYEEMLTVYVNGSKIIEPEPQNWSFGKSDNDDSPDYTCRVFGCGKEAENIDWYRRYWCWARQKILCKRSSTKSNNGTESTCIREADTP